MACNYFHGIETFECPAGGEDYKKTAISWVKAETDNGDIKTGKVTKMTAFNHYGDIIHESSVEGQSITCRMWIEDEPHTCIVTVGKKIVYSKIDYDYEKEI